MNRLIENGTHLLSNESQSKEITLNIFLILERNRLL